MQNHRPEFRLSLHNGEGQGSSFPTSVKLPSSSVAASEAPLRKTNAAASRAQAWCRKANQYASSMTRRKLTALAPSPKWLQSEVDNSATRHWQNTPFGSAGVRSSHNCTTPPCWDLCGYCFYIYRASASFAWNISFLLQKDRNLSIRLLSSQIPLLERIENLVYVRPCQRSNRRSEQDLIQT